MFVFDLAILSQYTLTMFSFAHAFTGGTIAYAAENPLVALPLALTSHFVLDMLPHWNPDIPKEKKKFGKISKKTQFIIFLDVLLALVLGLFIASLAYVKSAQTSSFVRIILGCFFAVLPDLIEAPLLLFNIKGEFPKRLLKIQSKLQWNIPLPWGLITQVVLVISLFLVFF